MERSASADDDGDLSSLSRSELTLRLAQAVAQFSRAGDDGDPLARRVEELTLVKLELEAANRDLRESTGALEESRNHYADLYAKAPVAFVTLDPHGLIVEVNEAATQLLGGTSRVVTGRPFVATALPASPRTFFDLLRMASETDGPVRERVRLLGIKPPRDVELTAVRTEHPRGARLAILDLCEDAAAREDAAVFHAFAWAAESWAAVTLEPTCGIKRWYASAERLYGYTAEEVVGRHVLELCPRDEKEPIARLLIELRSSGTAVTECVRRRKDGSTFPARVEWTRVGGTEERPDAIVEVVRDLSAIGPLTEEDCAVLLRKKIEQRAAACGLTGAEREVLLLALQGKSNKEIAQERGSSLATARTQIAAVLKKTGSSTRADLWPHALGLAAALRTPRAPDGA